ncbi:antibiotic biosynthesis monooxygenase family protein [Roseospira goensis]|uniref:Heme-degrading monooxygenase HmoA n=1 Tax=Roseospira goensis TaxID=391922 RepID=A0A7W6RYR1_9PROT|nr:antibiotic biosynthesis monooxygenase [Roseospira goensis]MBB4285698.1 heme-degrading monooxygenase HmoA [Roseospira goensis]
MIARIDILETPDAGPAARLWGRALRAAAGMPGFRGARLLRVYRRLNRTGYALVGLSRWDSLAAYHGAEDALHRRPFGPETPPGVNLYGRVDASPPCAQPVEAEQIVVTNPYRIDRGAAAENARMWAATKTLMQTREGFLDAELFQSFHPDADAYYFVSRARWRTEADFLRQFAGQDYKALVAPYEGTFQICFSRVADDVPDPAAPAIPGGADAPAPAPSLSLSLATEGVSS